MNRNEVHLYIGMYSLNSASAYVGRPNGPSEWVLSHGEKGARKRMKKELIFTLSWKEAAQFLNIMVDEGFVDTPTRLPIDQYEVRIQRKLVQNGFVG